VVVIMVILWVLNAVGVMGMFAGPLVPVLVALIVVGLLMWLVNSYIPMDARIKQILNVLVLIAVVLWLLSVFGVLSGLPVISVGNP
jgi:hypothetical protein